MTLARCWKTDSVTMVVKDNLVHTPTNNLAFAFEKVYVFFSRKQKLQQRFVLKSARLGYAQE
jgi:hypothetical protein